MAAPCIYHLKCKSLCLYSVQKSFYSPAHSVVTLPPSLPPSFALSPFPLCVPHFLSLSLTSLSLMLGLHMKLIDYCWRGLTEVQPVLDPFSLPCLTPPHVLSLLGCARQANRFAWHQETSRSFVSIKTFIMYFQKSRILFWIHSLKTCLSFTGASLLLSSQQVSAIYSFRLRITEESKGWILHYSMLVEKHNTVWKMCLIQCPCPDLMWRPWPAQTTYMDV